MNKIQRSIDAVLAGQLQLEQSPNSCLQAVRQVIEHANDWKGGAIYDHINYWAHRTPDNLRLAPAIPWARSFEQACIDQGMGAPLSAARAGHLVFGRVPKLQGHIGIVGEDKDGGLYVLENATVRRGRSLGGSLNWVPLSQWGQPSTVARLPDAWVFEALPEVGAARPAAHRILMPDGKGGYANLAGQRLEIPVNGTLVINASDAGTTWIDIRRAK